MTAILDTGERDRLAQLAQTALDRHQPGSYRITVDKSNIMHEDDWYHILVTTPQDVRTYEFYDALAEAEAELQDQQGLHLLLVPVIGD